MNQFENNVIVTENYISEQTEGVLLLLIKELMRGKLALSGSGRSRIVRYGVDYLTDTIWGLPPTWLPVVEGSDSWTINEYPPGHFIAPHIDSHKFDDEIHVLSLGVGSSMVFESPEKKVRAVLLPPRSLMSMRGEVRREWRHSTLPTNEGVRFSVVYRRKA